MGIFDWAKGKEDKTTYPVSQFMVMNEGQAQYTEMSYASLSKEGYKLNALAFTCIHKIKQAVASLDFYICDDEGNVIENHPAQALLDRPNPLSTRKDLLGTATAFYLIAGNTYLFNSNYDDALKPQTPRQIYALQPDAVKVISGKSMPKAYQVGDSSKMQFPVDQFTGSSAVCHIKDFDPLNLWYGQSRLQAAARAIDRFNASEQWNYNLVKNGAKPSGILTTKEDMTAEQFSEKTAELKKHWEGKGGVKLVDAGFEWKQMSLSPMDMDFRESQLMAARYIANVFGVPSQMLNIPESQTFSNYEQANLSFWQDTVIPIAEEIYAKIGMWLFSQYPNSEGLQIKIDLDKVSALDPIRREKADRYKGLVGAGVVTINEARDALSYGEIKGGDDLYINGSQVKLSDIADSELDDLEGEDDSE